MVRLAQSQYPAALALYLEHGSYFPLIAAVLIGKQDGVVFADCETNPSQVYVEHAFGFAQVFGASQREFERSLEHYLLVDKAFVASKVRLYTPYCPSFLQISERNSLRSWRQRFALDISHIDVSYRADAYPIEGLSLEHVNANHIGLIEDAFGLIGRFWRTPEDFVRYSNAVLALVKGKTASLCYAAAVVHGKAEIDVLTLAPYRHLGLAKAVVVSFNQRCFSQNVLPLWDCFTNNTASMVLGQSSGFVPVGDPYPFFTISR